MSQIQTNPHHTLQKPKDIKLCDIDKKSHNIFTQHFDTVTCISRRNKHYSSFSPHLFSLQRRFHVYVLFCLITFL